MAAAPGARLSDEIGAEVWKPAPRASSVASVVLPALRDRRRSPSTDSARARRAAWQARGTVRAPRPAEVCAWPPPSRGRARGRLPFPRAERRRRDRPRRHGSRRRAPRRAQGRPGRGAPSRRTRGRTPTSDVRRRGSNSTQSTSWIGSREDVFEPQVAVPLANETAAATGRRAAAAARLVNARVRRVAMSSGGPPRRPPRLRAGGASSRTRPTRLSALVRRGGAPAWNSARCAPTRRIDARSQRAPATCDASVSSSSNRRISTTYSTAFASRSPARANPDAVAAIARTPRYTRGASGRFSRISSWQKKRRRSRVP